VLIPLASLITYLFAWVQDNYEVIFWLRARFVKTFLAKKSIFNPETFEILVHNAKIFAGTLVYYELGKYEVDLSFIKVWYCLTAVLYSFLKNVSFLFYLSYSYKLWVRFTYFFN